MNGCFRSIVVLPCIWLLALCARADVSIGIDPTNKYAWSENTGWANLAPSNGGVFVHFDEASGYLAGYTWGENIGWIKFGADTGGPYSNDSATNWGVNLDAAGNLSGYAWGENVGWIKFNPAYGGVSIDTTNGWFSGYAWGENIGWLKFQGSAPDYNVRALSFETQPQGTPNWWLANHGVTEDYDEGDLVPAWEEYVADTDPNLTASFFHIVAVSNLPQAAVAFPSSARRYYTLQHCNDALSGDWSNVPEQTGIPGDGGTYFLQDTNALPRQLYRVNVTLSP